MRDTLALRYRIPVFAVLMAVAATAVYPVVFVALSSLRDGTDYTANPYGLPSSFSLENFRSLIDNYNLAQSFLNSVIVSVVGVTIVLTLASLAAYAIAKHRFRGDRVVFGVFLSVMLVPSQVLIIPVYLMFSRLELIGSLVSVILIYSATTLPFAVFFLTQTFRAVPSELIEAAQVDGASFLRGLWSIVLPVGRASLVTIGILTFLAMWNELLFGYMLLPDEAQQLLAPKMAYIGGQFVSNQPLLMAGLLVTSLPPLLVLTFMSRYLVKGITAGVGK